MICASIRNALGDPKQVNYAVIASPSMSAADVDAVRDCLLSLDATEAGKKQLVPTKWSGFAAYDQVALMAMGVWLGL
jgi:ABC-type phosphate/phosphonate transport system substrate-binding protein